MKDFKNTVRNVFNIPVLITLLLLQQISPVLAVALPDSLSTPIFLGFNLDSKSVNPNETPLDLNCPGPLYTNENSIALNWTVVEGENIKYQRKVTYPNGTERVGYYLTNNYTDFVTFGGSSGIEGLWKFSVKAFSDTNSNNVLDSGEINSEWSNECQIRYDKTAPGKPINLRWDSKDRTQEFPCGSYLPVGTFIPDWDDVTNEPNFSHYEYTSFNVGGVIGLNEVRMNQSEFVHSWIPPVEGTYGYAVRSVDLAGNKSEWALLSKSLDGSCKITHDSTAPSVPENLRFTNPALTCGSYTNIGRNTVDWDDSSDNSGVAGYEYFIDYPLPNGGRSTWQIFRTVSNYTGTLNQGLHKIKVRAKDNAGYYSAWTDFCEITYDSIAPVTTDTGTDNVLHNTDVTVDLNCSDVNGSGCWKTYYNINGGTFTEGNSIVLDTDGEYTIHYYSVDRAGNIETEKAAANIVRIDKTPPALNVTGATADGELMLGDITTGFELQTNNDPLKDYLLQFKSDTDASEPLETGYFGLKLVSSTVTPDDLINYYQTRGVPEPFLTYLKDAADGYNPFVYINTDTLKLVDAAKHDILGGSDVDMTVPGDFPLGTYTVEGKIFDLAGNEATVTLILKVLGDRVDPEVTVPADIETEATSGSGAVVNYASATAFDDVDGVVTVTCDPVSGSTFALGTTKITCNAFDTAGNEGVGFFDIKVVDTTAPIITQLSDLQAGSMTVNYTLPTASDIVDGATAVNCSPASGSTFPVGTTQVTCTSSDSKGNSSQMQFKVIVGTVLGSTTYRRTSSTTSTQVVVAVGDEQVTPTPTVTPTLELAEIGEVLGLEDQACSETFKASGEIYIDSNGDNVKQADEKGVSGIKLVIYTNDKVQNIELKSISTNSAGQWTTNLCPGDYKLKIDETTLPEGTKLQQNDISIVVTSEGDIEYNIPLLQIVSGFNWMYLLLLGGGGLLLLFIFRKKISN